MDHAGQPSSSHVPSPSRRWRYGSCCCLHIGKRESAHGQWLTVRRRHATSDTSELPSRARYQISGRNSLKRAYNHAKRTTIPTTMRNIKVKLQWDNVRRNQRLAFAGLMTLRIWYKHTSRPFLIFWQGISFKLCIPIKVPNIRQRQAVRRG